MADLPPRPVFTRTISFGNVVQICVLVFGFGVGWQTLTSGLDAVRDENEVLANDVNKASDARAGMEVRVRALEIEVARADERYSQLLAMMAAIRDSVVRLEQRDQ